MRVIVKAAQQRKTFFLEINATEADDRKPRELSGAKEQPQASESRGRTRLIAIGSIKPR